MLLNDPVIYSVRWVSNLNTQNDDEPYLLFKESTENRQSITKSIPYRLVQNTVARIAYLQSSTLSNKIKKLKKIIIKIKIYLPLLWEQNKLAITIQK